MKKIAISLFAIATAATVTFPQHIRNTDYSPDKALKSNARVNPSTLAMELSIPLGGYAGRAGNGLPITMSYSSKVWDMENVGQWPNNFDVTVNDIRPMFAKRTAAGWSSSLAAAYIDYQWERYEAATQGSPDYDGQIFAPAPWEEPPNNYLFYVKRLRVTLPDGSSHELRASDSLYDCGTVTGTHCTPDLTGTFLSVDGSRMRLESGSSSSTLYLPDGSRYIFGAPSGDLGLANEFYDRHGNKMTYTVVSGVGQWTDTMGRVVKDPLPTNWNGVQNQTTGEKTVEYPGLNSATDYDLKFTWDTLSNARLDTGEALRYTGWKVCDGEDYTSVSPYLFSDGGEQQTRICTLDATFNPVVLAKITLPNNQFYEFKYSVFGEITKIIYPNGGYERFVYGTVTPLQAGNYAYDMANRGVTNRYVSVKGDGTDEVASTFSATRTTSPAQYYVTSTAPDTSYTRQYLHEEPVGGTARQYGFSSQFTGRAYDERSYDNSTSHYLLSRKLTVYESTGPLSGGHSTATRDLRPTKEISIIFDPANSNALATMSETVYDTTGSTDAAYFSSLNGKQAKKYNYIVVAASTASADSLTPATAAGWFSSETAAVVTESDYLYDTNYKARDITGLVTETRVKDGSNIKAKTQIFYDEVGTYPLLTTDISVTTGHWEDPSSNYRGLVTTTKSWTDITNNLSVQTHSQFDKLGNLRNSWDANGNLSQIEYSSDYDRAYPTKTISPIPDTNGTYGYNDELEIITEYNFNTGLTTKVTDPNGLQTKMEYVDNLLRPTKVYNYYGSAQVGGATETSYGAGTSASTRWVKVKSQIDASSWKEALTWFDGLGRTVRSQAVDDEGDVFVLTCYDNMGRVSKTSNPFRGWTTQDCSTTTGMEWTTNTFDTAGRLWKVTAPDSAVVETTYSLAATSGYLLGTVVTVEDQADKQRRSVTNALGQLKRVDEPTTSGLGTLTSPNQDTTYSYDLLNNLTTVNQGAQTRTFTYDALSRLKQAVNPESGTINYTYDNNGNLATKADARSITTTYTYDRLNRVTLRAYTNEPSGSDTPDVSYYYDNITNAKGKLIKVSNSNSTTEYTSFDILGRVTGHKQTTAGGDAGGYTTAYAYNLGGALIEETYPSGRKVQNVLDASGDLAVVKSKKNATSGPYHNYAFNFIYDAAGAVTSMELGNLRYESTTFNSRLQPTQIAVGSTAGATNLLDLDYEYGATASVNNGNVTKQTINVPTVGSNVGFAAVQTYTYDELNRLKSATENVTPTGGSQVQTWKQTYTFDRYGNRRFDFTSSNTTTPESSCDEAVCNPTISTSNNRLSSSGWTYDDAGNTTAAPGSKTFAYDGENKQVEAKTGSTVNGQYWYDGDGKRVKKIAGNEVTIFVYDAAGKLVAEYSTTVASANDAKVAYLTNDHLGSPRINTDRDGNVTARHDYHPFGEEIATSQRTEGLIYDDDTVRKQFTGYERDGEVDLDFAQARYYNSNHGRFTTGDPLLASGKPVFPQSFNRYTYVRNNPMVLIDPNGLCDAPAVGKGQVGFCVEAFIAARRAGPGGHGDGRTFDGNNASLTSRIQVQFVLEATNEGVKFASPVQVKIETSRVQIAEQAEGGFAAAKVGEMRSDGTLAAAGTASAVATAKYENVKEGDFGNTALNVTGTGKNGFTVLGETLQSIPSVPTVAAGTALTSMVPGSIDFSMNFTVTGNGQVERAPGSEVRGYPSYAAYSYTRGSDGAVTTTKLREIPEGTIDQLNKPMKPVP